MEGNTLREVDYRAVEAVNDHQILNQFLLENEKFILRCASSVTYQYVTKSDDEWSIALVAFTQAVESYQLEKGSFYSFAELVIHRRLIDYMRKENKHNIEVSVDPIVFDTESDEENEDVSIRLAVAKQVSGNNQNELKLEIATANEVFATYGFSFFNLTECSPKATKTKSSCAKAISYLVSNQLLVKELQTSKQLSIKIIEKNTKVPRKILERHRKYIIAVVEILSGEYPLLAEYMNFVREETSK